VAADDLNAPLGQDKHKRLPKLPVSTPQLLVGVLGLFALTMLGWALFGNDPLGGEPLAAVATVQTAPGHAKTEAGGTPVAAAAKLKAAPPPGSKTVTIIDGSSGQSRNVVIPGKTGDGSAKAPVDH
jgi:hypothetical protein